MSGLDHLAHGGRTRELAIAAGVSEEELLDFSANINPAGPPPWLGEAVAEGAKRIGVYPDPDSLEAREAASSRYGAPRERFLFADGADSIILALPRALGSVSCVVPSPTYSGYLRAAARSRCEVVRVALEREEGYSLASSGFIGRFARAIASAKSPALAFLGSPNNPVGGRMPRDKLLEIIARFPGAAFVVDESFAELAGDEAGLIAEGAPNLVIVRSLTKTWAVPGARVGFASASPELLSLLRADLPSWPLSSFAQAIARRALLDVSFAARSADYIACAEETFSRKLIALAEGLGQALGEIHVYRSGANFLLLEFSSPEICEGAAGRLLDSGIATRRFSEAEGLDGRFMRIAVRRPEENDRFARELSAILGGPTGEREEAR
jgi:adenosylcobyric acid synthase